MKVCKIFNSNELIENINTNEDINLLEYLIISRNINGHFAIPWYVENSSDYENYEEFLINKYLISQGCEINELVYIDVSW